MDIKIVKPFIEIYLNSPKRSKAHKNARDEIIIYFSKVVDYKTNQIYNAYPYVSDVETLRTAGLLAIFFALENYDPNNKGKALLTSWIHRVINCKMIGTIRHNTMIKRQHYNAFSLNEKIHEDDDEEYGDVISGNTKDYYNYLNKDLIEQIRLHLPQKDLATFEHWLKNIHTPLRCNSQELKNSYELIRTSRIRLAKKIQRLFKNK